MVLFSDVNKRLFVSTKTKTLIRPRLYSPRPSLLAQDQGKTLTRWKIIRVNLTHYTLYRMHMVLHDNQAFLTDADMQGIQKILSNNVFRSIYCL